VVIFGLGMRYYLRVKVGYGFGLINLVLLHSKYLYRFSVEPFVQSMHGHGTNALFKCRSGQRSEVYNERM